jgi:hypothetical protein
LRTLRRQFLQRKCFPASKPAELQRRRNRGWNFKVLAKARDSFDHMGD